MRTNLVLTHFNGDPGGQRGVPQRFPSTRTSFCGNPNDTFVPLEWSSFQDWRRILTTAALVSGSTQMPSELQERMETGLTAWDRDAEAHLDTLKLSCFAPARLQDFIGGSEAIVPSPDERPWPLPLGTNQDNPDCVTHRWSSGEIGSVQSCWRTSENGIFVHVWRLSFSDVPVSSRRSRDVLHLLRGHGSVRAAKQRIWLNCSQLWWPDGTGIWS